MMASAGRGWFSPRFAVILITNLLPLAGIFLAGWDSGQLLVLYWIENIVIGLFGIGKLLAFDFHHGGEDALTFSALSIPFYLAHYGLFCYGHAFLLQKFYLSGALPVYLERGELWVMVLALVVVHALSFRVDFLGRGIRELSRDEITFGPYKRLIVLHASLLLAAAAMAFIPWTYAAVIFLMVIKLGYDSWAWRSGHMGLETD